MGDTTAMNDITWHHHPVTKAERARLNKQKPFVIWLTGLSGAGKSTLAGALESYLHQNGNRCYLLDGDNIRHGLSKDLGFDHESRAENIRRVGEVAKLMVDAGLIVVTAFISPFSHERRMVREMFEPGEFVEIYLNAALQICEQRDPKGLYKKARSGGISDFTGISSPYEIPSNPEIVVNTGSESIEACLQKIITMLIDKHYLNSLQQSLSDAEAKGGV